MLARSIVPLSMRRFALARSFPAITILLGGLTVIVQATERFATAAHWDAEYSRGRYGDKYEWYDLVWSDLKPLLTPLLPTNSEGVDVLVSGCGNSLVNVDMAKEPFVRQMISTDISSVVISSMAEKHPGMQWAVADSRTLSNFSDASFDLVFDKGALDAIRGSKDPSLSREVFTAYRRVLRANGVAYIVSSCEEDECLPMLREHFHSVVTHRIPKKDIETKKKQAAVWGFEVREHDTAYVAKVSDDSSKAEL
eukprot:TRINITY_DN23612_c0_g1_i1.p1 TRINITY_DN23612_c0_g1~~TRINITY_DN23612_c0_g1_i1.p1  ORF type:complete len:252 (-),score=22.08 TRINITY_DN23612_c0_g1_i1:13-768(-)